MYLIQCHNLRHSSYSCVSRWNIIVLISLLIKTADYNSFFLSLALIIGASSQSKIFSLTADQEKDFQVLIKESRGFVIKK